VVNTKKFAHLMTFFSKQRRRDDDEGSVLTNSNFYEARKRKERQNQHPWEHIHRGREKSLEKYSENKEDEVFDENDDDETKAIQVIKCKPTFNNCLFIESDCDPR